MSAVKKYGDCFKVKFNILDYIDVCPEPPKRIEDYLNWDKPTKECVWKKQVQEEATPRYREQEALRILKTGVWIFIKTMPVWIPPNYYFALQYGKAGSADMEFRLKRLKHVYFKIRARLNKGCKGTLTLKNRGDGETTMAIHDGFWECLDGNMETGQIGIQSKTRSDAINPCWGYVQTIWQSLPMWLKNDLSGDFSSGTSIAEKMQWQRNANEKTGVKARNILFTFYPSGTPMDGKHDMKKCILDEICKWEETNTFYDTFTNYSKFIMPGFQRRGMFDMFSSPADNDCKSNQEVYALWKDSDPDEITGNGTTKSRVHRYYSNPLEGIAGAYDEFGDADPEEIKAHIMAERAKMPKDKLFGEVRGYPLNEEEMFGMTDKIALWSNIRGLNERSAYLIGRRYKDAVTKEPIGVYGNLVWIDGRKDGDVGFKMAEVQQFDVITARFFIPYLPQHKQPLQRNSEGILQPPDYVESCLGIDPIAKRYAGKTFSNASMVDWKFRDVHETGIVNCVRLCYRCRPSHSDIFFEDAIKAAIFTQSMVQVENLNDKIIDYFEDRGYINWMLSKIGKPKNSLIKGDAPSGGGKNAFLDEVIGFIDARTNTPLNEGELYLLEKHWCIDLIDDVIKFNPKDTHTSDYTMAWGQALMGAEKITYKKIREKNTMTGLILDYLN